VSKTTK